jgi:hypothetical protein
VGVFSNNIHLHYIYALMSPEAYIHNQKISIASNQIRPVMVVAIQFIAVGDLSCPGANPTTFHFTTTTTTSVVMG